MTKTFAITLMIGLMLVGAGVWTIFYKQAGAHIEPKGSILKVRTLSLDEKSSAAVVDLRITNDSDYALVTRTIEATTVTGNGNLDGNIVAETDAKGLFKNYPILGEQFNPILKMRDEVPPHSSIDREICAQFPISSQDLDQRKDLVVRYQDKTGPIAEIHEKLRAKP